MPPTDPATTVMRPRGEETGGPINWAALHASYIAAGVIVGFFVLLLGCLMVWGPGWYKRRREKMRLLELQQQQEQAIQDGIPLSPTSTKAGDHQPQTTGTAKETSQPVTSPVTVAEADRKI